MKLIINGESKVVAVDKPTISALLVHENVQMPETVSVEHNGSILSRDAFNSTAIQDGDTVEFLYFMGGG